MGLSSDELCFGTGWGEPARQRHYKDAFGLVVAAIRRHYGIWPADECRHRQLIHRLLGGDLGVCHLAPRYLTPAVRCGVAGRVRLGRRGAARPTPCGG
jgi:hypothetical protein